MSIKIKESCPASVVQFVLFEVWKQGKTCIPGLPQDFDLMDLYSNKDLCVSEWSEWKGFEMNFLNSNPVLKFNSIMPCEYTSEQLLDFVDNGNNNNAFHIKQNFSSPLPGQNKQITQNDTLDIMSGLDLV